MAAPGFWMNETSGVLRPAIEAYLHRRPMNAAQVAAMRAYLRQWVMSPVWDLNPFANTEGGAPLPALRASVDAIQTERDIDNWIQQATEQGMDPL